jgi:hypothetical protein
MTLTQYLGDTVTHEIPLRWQGVDFYPTADWTLYFTAKKKQTDPDSSSIIQKATAAGLTVTGSLAAVSIFNADTASEKAGSLYYDIRAKSTSTGAVRTLAKGRLKLDQNVARAPQLAVNVLVAEDYTPGAQLTGATLVTTLEGLTEEQLDDARAALGLVDGITIVTQAEYDALSAEQIADPTKFYIIQG